MLHLYFKAAVENGHIGSAKSYYEQCVARYGEDAAKAKLLDISLLAATLKKFTATKNNSYYEVVSFLKEKMDNLDGLDAHLDQPLITYCATNGLSSLFWTEILKRLDIPENVEEPLSVSFVAERIAKCDTAIQAALRAGNDQDANLFVGARNALLQDVAFPADTPQKDIIKLIKKNPITKELIRDIVAKIAGEDTITYTNILTHALNGDYSYKYIYKDDLLDNIDITLGKSLGMVFAEKGLYSLTQDLEEFLQFEELRMIAKQGDITQLETELKAILPNNSNSFEEIFNGILADVLKNKQWEMATYLFARGARVPTQAELGADFMDFVEEHQIRSLMLTRRYQFYRKVMRNDEETVDKLTAVDLELPNPNEPEEYQKGEVFPDIYLLTKLGAAYNRMSKSADVSSEDMKAVREPLVYLLIALNHFTMTEYIHEFLEINLFDLALETGVTDFMDLIHPNEFAIEVSQLIGKAESALIEGNGNVALEILRRTLHPTEEINIRAAALAQTLINEDYDTAAELINEFNADIDFSSVQMKEHAQFKGDLIGWIMETPAAQSLLECPRIAEEVKKRELLEAKPQSPKRVQPIIHTQSASKEEVQPDVEIQRRRKPDTT